MKYLFIIALLFVATPVYAASTFPATADLPQSASVESRWLLDEASGNAIDLESAGNDLTDTNTVGAGTGMIQANASYDNSRDFENDTVNEYFTIDDNASLSPTTGFTFSFWVIDESSDANTYGVSKWNTTGNQRTFLFLLFTANQAIQISDNGTNSTPAVTDLQDLTGSFEMITLVFEASTRITIYKYGVQTAENTTSIPAAIHDGTAKFQIGFIDGAGGATSYDGVMQDMIYWKNQALTDAEVTTLFNLWTVAVYEGFEDIIQTTISYYWMDKIKELKVLKMV